MLRYLGENLLMPDFYLFFVSVLAGILLLAEGYKNEIPVEQEHLSANDISKWKSLNKRLCYIEGSCFILEGLLGKFAPDNLITAIVMTVVGVTMFFCVYLKMKNNRKWRKI